MNTRSDDELLSAYIDGELADDETERLTARLAAEPGLAQRLEALRSTDEAARRLYEQLDERPLPDAVLELLEESDHRAPDNVVEMPVKAERHWFAPPVALAASVALVAGILAGNFFFGAPGQVRPESLYAGNVDPDSDLHRLLEAEISARPVELDGSATGRVLLTFESTEGRYCRQFRLDREVESVQGLACRGDDAWRLDTVSYGPAAGAGYQTASGTVAPAVAAAVEAQIGEADPLDPEAELDIISEGWKKSRD
ncbi:MAG: hypothetical protein R3315_02530 [Woeseiaceae bacterium]|nr:hypothetical protein [Woeseiaceae bacterium]